jgi:Rieske Fe-S protein
MAEARRSRRQALRSLSAALVAAAALWRFLTPRGAPGGGPGPLEVPEADVPREGALVLPRHRCAIVRQGASVLALDLTCTHLGCTVKATSEGFACPCHGSRFGPGGEVVRGPATRALRRLAVEARGATLRVARERAGA